MQVNNPDNRFYNMFKGHCSPPSVKRNNGHRQAEAYFIMQYKCESCGDIEKLWNSRDAVTPYMVDCLKCGNIASHVNWNEDIYSPDFIPPDDMRIFISITEKTALSKANEIISHRLKMQKDRPEIPVPNLDDLTKDLIGDGNQPTIITGREYKKRKLKEVILRSLKEHYKLSNEEAIFISTIHEYPDTAEVNTEVRFARVIYDLLGGR